MKNQSTKCNINQLMRKFQSLVIINTKAIKGGNTGYSDGFADGEVDGYDAGYNN